MATRWRICTALLFSDVYVLLIAPLMTTWPAPEAIDGGAAPPDVVEPDPPHAASSASEMLMTVKATGLRGVLVVVVRFIELNILVLRFCCAM
jgi:hypothetical protein